MVDSNQTLKLVGLSQGAAKGVQTIVTIVNLQFRKEHRALLDLFEDLKAKVDKSSADAERRVEESQKQLEETESRLKKLENECRDLTQKNKDWENQVKNLKGKMMKLGELMGAVTGATSAPPLHGCLDDTNLQQSQSALLAASSTHDHPDIADIHHAKSTSTIASSQTGLNTPALKQLPSTFTAKHPEPVLRAASVVEDTTLNDRDQYPWNSESNRAMPSPTQNNQTSPYHPPSPLTTSQVTKHISSSSGKSVRKATSRKLVWASIAQTLDQDIEAYLDFGAQYIGAIKVRKTQFEFIARFIGGLLHEKDRDALLKHLQKKFSSRINKDGFVEVMCAFADVGDALMAVGLLGGRDGKRGVDAVEMAASQHKRRKTAGSQLSEDDDDEL